MALERYIKVSISNTSQEPVRVALLPSYLAQSKFILENGKIKQIASAEALRNAGYAVDFIAQDGKQELGELSVEVSSAQGYSNFSNFLAYIKNNPIALKQLTIISDTVKVSDVPDDPDIINYNYSAVVQGGGGTITPASGIIAEGLSQEFTLNPEPGYIIDKLLDNNIDKTDKIMKRKYILENVKEEHDIVATFKKLPFKITADANTKGGKISPNGKNMLVDAGSTQIFDITVEEGYDIDKLVDNNIDKTDKIKNNQYTLSEIDKDHVIILTFKKKEYNVTIENINPNLGSISPVGTVKVTHGSTLDLVITPKEDGYISELIFDDDGEEISVLEKIVNGKYTTDAFTDDAKITVFFDPKEFEFRAKVEGGNGTISPSSGLIFYDNSKEFTITPDAGYLINKVTDNGTDVTNKLIAD